MTDITLPDMDMYSSTQDIPKGYPPDRITLFSPVDEVHQALLALINSAQTSLDIAMFAFTDTDLQAAVEAKMGDPAVKVRLTLDFSQSALDEGERNWLTAVKAKYPDADISIGNSEKNAIMHLKAGVIDGTVMFNGSTNWSTSGQEDQDNQLTVSFNAVEAAQLTARMDAIHAWQLANPV